MGNLKQILFMGTAFLFSRKHLWAVWTGTHLYLYPYDNKVTCTQVKKVVEFKYNYFDVF